jgi:hypothetical protein
VGSYKKDSVCVKCGEVGASTEYVEKIVPNSMTFTRDESYMIRVCQNCGSWWHEEPLDAVDTNR